jgi:hypothetical protein
MLACTFSLPEQPPRLGTYLSIPRLFVRLAAGIASCHAYKTAVYNMLGLTGADRGKRERNPPHHLVIWDRKGRRGFINIDEIIE